MMFVRPSVCGTAVHRDHNDFSADFSLWLDNLCSGHRDIKACSPTPADFFPVSPVKRDVAFINVHGGIKARAQYCGFDTHS